VLLKKLLS